MKSYWPGLGECRVSDHSFADGMEADCSTLVKEGSASDDLAQSEEGENEPFQPAPILPLLPLHGPLPSFHHERRGEKNGPG